MTQLQQVWGRRETGLGERAEVLVSQDGGEGGAWKIGSIFEVTSAGLNRDGASAADSFLLTCLCFGRSMDALTSATYTLTVLMGMGKSSLRVCC